MHIVCTSFDLRCVNDVSESDDLLSMYSPGVIEKATTVTRKRKDPCFALSRTFGRLVAFYVNRIRYIMANCTFDFKPETRGPLIESE